LRSKKLGHSAEVVYLTFIAKVSKRQPRASTEAENLDQPNNRDAPDKKLARFWDF
jgi:hypothetical protein